MSGKIQKSTEENLESRLWERTNAIEEALIRLKKASLLLSHWTQEYGFYESPNPRLIFDNTVPNSDKFKLQAFKWFWEYNYIFYFVDMVEDYIFETQKILEEALVVKE